MKTRDLTQQERKAKKRVKRHAHMAMDAVTRAIDGCDIADGMLGNDAYILKQLAIATEELAMAKQRITDYQTEESDK